MFNIEIADLVITIDNKYPYVKSKCVDYITKKENSAGIVLSVTEKRMQYSIDYKLDFDEEKITFPEAEFDAIHYELYDKLSKHRAFWLHSVLIEKDGQGYAFTAKPGCGKSTHAKLWLEQYPDAIIVNGDNTIVRKSNIDGIWYGYGTPFCGKEGYNKNTKVPIKAICFLNRSEKNFVENKSSMESIMNMLEDNFCIRGKEKNNTMRLLLDLSEQVKFYDVYCNMELDAAKIAYEGISK